MDRNTQIIERTKIVANYWQGQIDNETIASCCMAILASLEGEPDPSNCGIDPNSEAGKKFVEVW